MRMLSRLLVAVFVSVAVIAGGLPELHANQTLTAGRYTAKAKALVCGACVKKIMDTARAFPGIESASVDRKSSTLEFVVGPDAHVDVAQLQSALKAASDEMGMGADYTLSDIRKAGKAKARKTPKAKD